VTSGIGVSLINPGFVETPLTAQKPVPHARADQPRSRRRRRSWTAGRGGTSKSISPRFTLWMKALQPAAVPHVLCRHPPLHRAYERRRRTHRGVLCGAGPADLTRLGDFYTPDAYFKDPFNEVRGVAAIQGIFRHMFDALDTPRFVITSRVVDGDQCFLVWEFRFAFKSLSQGRAAGGPRRLASDTGPDGRIQSHRDYWDAAEELYEKLPLVGGLMRWLKRRSNS
jgi:hypothetical protein